MAPGPFIRRHDFRLNWNWPSFNIFQEFSNDPAFLEKIRNLRSRFSHFRRTRPDGNCFFRAMSFAYFEHLLTDHAEFERFREVVIPTKDRFAEVGFPVFTSEDFYDNFVDTLERLQVVLIFPQSFKRMYWMKKNCKNNWEYFSMWQLTCWESL